MKVLVVEDNHLMLQSLQDSVLSIRPNAAVLGARSLKSADDILTTNGPVDAILLDLGLPDSDGFEALRYFTGLAPNAVIAVVSGSSEPEVIRACFVHGASAYIEKSRDLDRFLLALRSFLDRGFFIPPGVSDAVSVPMPRSSATKAP